MIYIVIFVLFVCLFYYIYKLRKDLLWWLGEGSTAHFSLYAQNSIYDRPLIRKLLGISEKYNDKKFSELPEAEQKKVGKFARSEGKNLHPGFLFFYDKDLVFESIERKGYFSAIPHGIEDYLFIRDFHDEDYKQEVNFIISKRWVENVIPGQKIPVYTGYLKDGEIDFNSKKKWTEKVDILFDFPVALTLPLPRSEILNSKLEKERSARKDLAKKFGLDYKEGELNIDGFEGNLGSWQNPSTPGCYVSKYFEFYV
jgi:hypothetical protein